MGVRATKGVRYLLLLALPVSLAAQHNAAPQGRVVADGLWSQLQAVKWGAAQSQWQVTHPEATCQQFRGDGDWKPADGQWSYRCTRRSQTQTVEHFFYAFGLKKPLVARLRQFRAYVNGFTPAILEEAHRILEERLTTAHGPSVVPGTLTDFEPAEGHGVRRWATKRLDLHLYLEDQRQGSVRLGLVVRQRKLLDVLEKGELLAKLLQAVPASHGRSLDSELAEKLRYTFVNLPTLMMQTETERDPAELRTTLAFMLRKAQAASPDRRALLLLAAARVAERLPAIDFEAHPGFRSAPMPRLQFAGYGSAQTADTPADARAYANTLLWHAWMSHSESGWGEQAFLLLQARGWETTDGCADGGEQIRAVIGHGEDFLARRKRTPHRLEVTLALAQASETWWSLGQACGPDAYGMRAHSQKKAVSAREKAIEYYQQVLKLAPKSIAAAYARLRLPRLKLNIDTNQRRFSCLQEGPGTPDRFSAATDSEKRLALSHLSAEVSRQR